ncbi:MAG: RNA-binding S4 domain-containing protein [Desulfotomaculum sp.]|nr:RNA-binding S4 domain-containing protein [Desulfotomaculum sp.]
MFKEIKIKDTIKLDQFLKWANVTSTGGQSKLLIKSGLVKVNGEVENRRGRKLVPGDLIEVNGAGKFKVAD